MAAGGGFGSGFGFGFEFDQEGNLPGGSFSRLLLSDDVVSPPLFPVSPPHPPCTPLFSFDTPKMLCFGDFSEGDETGGSQITTQSVCSSPVSKSSSNACINSLPRSSNGNKRRNGSPPPPTEKEAAGDLTGSGAPASREQSGSKKSRPAAAANGSRSGTGHAKKLIQVKKREKLGDRIATLQQLVSPYGKTDTASVLHETMGYIRFLQDQVKVLCSPYLQRLPSSLPSTVTSHGEKYECRNFTQGLKSKGLCLVPVDGIVEMTNCNGADLWSQVTSRKDVVVVATTNAAVATTTTTVVTTTTSSVC